MLLGHFFLMVIFPLNLEELIDKVLVFGIVPVGVQTV